jgi:hypothetical protein
MVILQVGFCYALHVGRCRCSAIGWVGGITHGMRMSWMYGPSCTALPRIGSDCSTHPVYQWSHGTYRTGTLAGTHKAQVRPCTY